MFYALRKTYQVHVGRLVVTAMATLSLLTITFIDCVSHGGHRIAHQPGDEHSHGLQLAETIADVGSSAELHHSNGLESTGTQIGMPCHGHANTESGPLQPSDPDPAHGDCPCCSIAQCFSCLVPTDGSLVIAWTPSQRPVVRPVAALTSPLWRLERPPKTTA